MNKIYRQEIKKKMNSAQALLLENRISAILQQDLNTNENGNYYIRSIYFDTFSDSAYNEKMIGINNREKYRIRFYELNDQLINLERKEKKGNLIYKESTKIDVNTLNSLINNDFECLKKYNTSLTNDFYAKAKAKKMRPVVIVDYVRRAYVFSAGNVRITFDSQIQSRKIEGDLWSKGELYQALPNEVIVEIKFNKYLPEHIRNIVCSIPGHRLALSKYTICRENLLRKQGDYLGGK